MTKFFLKVQLAKQDCFFELSWGSGQHLNVTVPYPKNLTTLYQEWQRIYLSFYNTALRGRVEEIGSLSAPPIDWHARLVQAEAQLLSEFHKWLRSGELYEIRAVIANGLSLTANSQQSTVDIFLSCDAIELARLPWETWEIGTDFALASEKIRIVRQPINIHKASKTINQRYAKQARVLVILGDDTGLDFKLGKAAIYKYFRKEQVKFIIWQVGKDIAKLKTDIINALSSESGWDILFFAGHSNETNLTGGEIAIAPNVALSISELAPYLTTAIEKGLQFALFNSCKGLSIANTLIDLGLSQVAVMREPIHNSVAEEFLVRFLQALAEYKDVHEALLIACKYFKTEKNLTYPGAYLIPSLFRHPNAELFCLKPFGLKSIFKRLQPTRTEAIALSTLLFISLQLPVQQYLLERRVLIQSIYRQVTRQVEPVTSPPVLLVQINNESIRRAGIFNPKPMDRKYLAQLVDKLKTMQARVVGIDYLLDRPQRESDRILANSIQAAVNSSSNPTLFVFAINHAENGEWLKVSPDIASSNWSLQGEMNILPYYMQLLSPSNSNSEPWYFSSLLAISLQLQQITDTPQPQLNSQKDFFQQINTDFSRHQEKYKKTILTSERAHLQFMTALSYWFEQMWFHPIIDFSIPPNQVYTSIPAWKLLENQDASQNLQHKIVIIAPEGYEEAGILKNKEDSFNLPMAVDYWRHQEEPVNESSIFTGGETHAYMVHHYLNQRLVVPIPDFWMVGLAILLGKILYLSRIFNQPNRWRLLIVFTVMTGIYGIVSLQIYISSTAIILPWLLPSVTLWLYILSAFFRRATNE
ncbi:CHASE2 domain-containing protein [Scytonema sp. PRP1]|uniref:CHASE2 domain-containing protein n=1 Tax=Scytonema sp. PRP1 TaxID=3120513 RepID=UPI00300C3CAF